MANKNSFTVYNASAGSGKTYTLVLEYLILLIQAPHPESYRNILAITFTNKAVAEMKSRIINSLNALSFKGAPGNAENLILDLMDRTGYSEQEIRQKSGKILKSILHNYAAFDISTIDRFTYKIIKAFATELEIPSNFEVELNTRLVIQEAVDRLINKAGEDKVLTRILTAYTISKTDEDKSWDISRDLYKFAELLTQENHLEYLNLLKEKKLSDFESLSAQVKLVIEQTEQYIKLNTKGFFELIGENNLEKSDFSGGYLFNYFQKLKEQDFKVDFSSKWHDSVADQPLYPKRVKDPKRLILDSLQPKIVTFYEDSKAAVLKRDYFREIAANIVPLSLLNAIAREITEIKKERSLVLISDFNPTIAREIKDQPTPFIYEHIGERYNHYFIDEFQDTSEVQWNNLIPLIDHALSTELPGQQQAGLSLVGDAKQSIYRFRGGKAEQFIGLCNDTNPFNLKKTLNSLPNNYRSAPEIVDFNNKFFKFVAEKFDNPVYRELFNACEQIPKKDRSGFVNISFLDAENKTEEEELHTGKVLEIIKNLEIKAVPKSDICILTRTRKQSFTIAGFLSEQGIGIVSSESLLVSGSAEVRFITDLLEFSQNNSDKNLKWNILNYLSEKLCLPDRHAVISENIELDEQQIFNWLRDYGIKFNLNRFRDLPLYQAAEYVVESFDLVKESNAYVQFYLDFIFEKSRNSEPGIPAFLEVWEQEKEKLSIVAPKSRDAVQIMTIHKSKGLEFPVVIYPFASTPLKDVKRGHVWLHLPKELSTVPVGYFRANQKMQNWGDTPFFAYKELMDQTWFDNINVLYVAFTRASQQLYIISDYDLKDSTGNPDRVSGLLIAFLKSLSLWEDKVNYEFGSSEYQSWENDPGPVTISQRSNYNSWDKERLAQLVTTSGVSRGSLQEKAIQKGILVHNVLSKVNTYEDLPEAMRSISEEEKILPEELSQLEETLEEVISHSSLAAYFSTGVKAYRERAILSPGGEILRPDRLNFEEKNVTILDYKTGEKAAAHNRQMEQYAGILSNMGFIVTNQILVYINDKVEVIYL